MHLVSTLNNLSRSGGNIPVALFCYDEKRKFVRVSEDYQETTRLVKASFHIDQETPLRLETSALDVCQGHKVIIDESAYPLMWNVLDEIHVTLDEDKVAGNVPDAQRKERGKGKDTIPTPLPTPDSTGPVASGSYETLDEEFHDADDMHKNADAEEVNEMLTDPTPSTQAPVKTAEKVTTKAGEQPPLTREKEREKERETSNEKSEGSKAEAQRGGQAVLGSKRSYENILGNADDKEEGGSKRQKFKPVSSVARGGRTSPLTPINNDDGFPRVKQEKPTGTPPPYSSLNDNNIKSPKKPSPPAPTATQGAEADPRLEIIIFGLTDDQQAKFKTRGKHPVRKILAAACKSFGIDQENAKLVHIISVDDEEEELELAEEESIARCGVDSESLLRIRLKDVKMGDSADLDEYEEGAGEEYGDE
ncbi:hypothetical protein CPC08DRAFT_754277 [Agrocybe pediades]|nr:hypothetical protein CPC08DRAFT_754277 [Agrocybe pediades]